MPVLGKLALTVLAGGVALGAMLGAAANPVMKEAPEQPWRNAIQAPVESEAGYILIEAGPQDLSPYQDSYAPTWAREELTDWEPDYPEWTYSELAYDGFEDPLATDEQNLDGQPATAEAEEIAAPETPSPAVETAALDAPPANEPPAPPSLAGIY